MYAHLAFGSADRSKAIIDHMIWGIDKDNASVFPHFFEVLAACLSLPDKLCVVIFLFFFVLMI